MLFFKRVENIDQNKKGLLYYTNITIKIRRRRRRVVEWGGSEIATLNSQRRPHWKDNIKADLKEMREWCMYISLEEQCRHKIPTVGPGCFQNTQEANAAGEARARRRTENETRVVGLWRPFRSPYILIGTMKGFEQRICMIFKMLNRILCYSGENLLLGASWIIYVWVFWLRWSMWNRMPFHIGAKRGWLRQMMTLGFSHKSMRDSTFLWQTPGDFFSHMLKIRVFFFFVLTYFKNNCFKKKLQPIMAVTKKQAIYNTKRCTSGQACRWQIFSCG